MPINAEVRAEIKRMLDIKADTGRTYRDELRIAFKASQGKTARVGKVNASSRSLLAEKENKNPVALSAVLDFVEMLENDAVLGEILRATDRQAMNEAVEKAKREAAEAEREFDNRDMVCAMLAASDITFDELVGAITKDVQTSTPTRLPLRTAAVAGTASLLTAGGIMAALATTGAMPAAIAAFGLVALGPIAPLALAAIVLAIAIAAAVVIVAGIGLKTSRGTFSLSSKKDYTPNAEGFGDEPAHQATHSGRPPQSNPKHHASPTQTANAGGKRHRSSRHHHKHEKQDTDASSSPKLDL